MTEEKSPFMHFVSIKDIRQEGKVEHTVNASLKLTHLSALSPK
ncbi:hypothetical protein [Salinivibrio kushneri]|nr:hypothetical protein [Salinivibrio kushneri]